MNYEYTDLWPGQVVDRIEHIIIPLLTVFIIGQIIFYSSYGWTDVRENKMDTALFWMNWLVHLTMFWTMIVNLRTNISITESKVTLFFILVLKILHILIGGGGVPRQTKHTDVTWGSSRSQVNCFGQMAVMWQSIKSHEL